jgi:hypothetical protein
MENGNGNARELAKCIASKLELVSAQVGGSNALWRLTWSAAAAISRDVMADDS